MSWDDTAQTHRVSTPIETNAPSGGMRNEQAVPGFECIKFQPFTSCSKEVQTHRFIFLILVSIELIIYTLPIFTVFEELLGKAPTAGW